MPTSSHRSHNLSAAPTRRASTHLRLPFPLLLSILLTFTFTTNAPLTSAEQTEIDQAKSSSISHSRQFIARGGQAAHRTSVSQIGEALKKELRQIFPGEEPDAWGHQIVVEFVGKIDEPRPPYPFVRSIVTGTPRFYQITAHVGQGLQATALEKELLHLILLERALRDFPTADLTAGLEVPEWILEGTLEAIRFAAGTSDRRFYQGLLQNDQILDLEDLLTQDNYQQLDRFSQLRFRASAGALVMALANQEAGKDGMLAALRNLTLSPDEPKDTLTRLFPALTLGKDSLEKWWALRLARLATPLLSESMTLLQTEQRLNEILTFEAIDPENGEATTFNVTQLNELIAHPNGKSTLNYAQQQLSQLSYRCFPDYRPLLLEYSMIFSELQTKGSTKNLNLRINNLADERIIMTKVATRARDYLDWHQITSPGPRSQEFAQFLKAMQKLRQEDDKRDDPIAKYLDEAERLFDY